jgi:hypothetical protein
MATQKPTALNAQIQSPGYNKFDGGLNIRDFWHTIADNELTVAYNICLDEGGVLRRRGGWSKLFATAVGTAGNLIGVTQSTFVAAGVQTRYVVATDGTKVFYYTGAAWSDITGATVMSPINTTIVSFSQFNNLLIAFDGKNAPWTWDGAAASISLLGGSPPTGAFSIVWQNRLFVAGVNTARNRLYYSAVGDQATWGASAYVDIPSPYDGDDITGLAILYGNLIVFKRNSIYIIQGDTPDNWVVSKSNSAVGCVSPYSVVSAENLVYFVSDKGLYAMNMSNTKQICYKVEPNYNRAVKNQLSGSLAQNRIMSCHYKFRNEIWMAMDASGTGLDKHDRMEVHNYNVVDKNGDPAVSEHYRYGSLTVTLNTNDYIDFTENGGAQVSAQLTAGTYSIGASSAESGTLCALIKTKMDAAGTGVYTVTHSASTDKITITRNSGVFVLKFSSGTNTLKNASAIMGFGASDTASAISATSSSTVKAKASTFSYMTNVAPSIMSSYIGTNGNVIPIASFYDKYVYIFTDGINTDDQTDGSAQNVELSFMTGYRDFGDSEATKTLRNVWTNISFTSTPTITIGVLQDDFSAETTGTLTPSSPSTFYNTKQPARQIFGSSPQGKYFKFGFGSKDGGSFSFFEMSYDIIWNGRRN